LAAAWAAAATCRAASIACVVGAGAHHISATPELALVAAAAAALKARSLEVDIATELS
jgi:hypothetical protein